MEAQQIRFAPPTQLRLTGDDYKPIEKKVEYNGKTYLIGKPTYSERKGKKYKVDVFDAETGEKVATPHWGAVGYDDFYIHKDPKRRENFRRRMKGALGEKSKDPRTPGFHAIYHNW